MTDKDKRYKHALEDWQHCRGLADLALRRVDEALEELKAAFLAQCGLKVEDKLWLKSRVRNGGTVYGYVRTAGFTNYPTEMQVMVTLYNKNGPVVYAGPDHEWEKVDE